MDFDTYQTLAMRTAKKLPTMGENLAHAALGIISEFGEIAEATSPEQVAEEVGDAFWFVALACTALGIKMDALSLTSPDSHLFPVEGRTSDTNIAKAAGAFAGFAKRVAVYGKEPTDAMKWDAYHALVNTALIPAGQDVLEANIEKLKLRYPSAYSDEAAEARADKGGADALNS